MTEGQEVARTMNACEVEPLCQQRCEGCNEFYAGEGSMCPWCVRIGEVMREIFASDRDLGVTQSTRPGDTPADNPAVAAEKVTPIRPWVRRGSPTPLTDMYATGGSNGQPNVMIGGETVPRFPQQSKAAKLLDIATLAAVFGFVVGFLCWAVT